MFVIMLHIGEEKKHTHTHIQPIVSKNIKAQSTEKSVIVKRTREKKPNNTDTRKIHHQRKKKSSKEKVNNVQTKSCKSRQIILSNFCCARFACLSCSPGDN